MNLGLFHLNVSLLDIFMGFVLLFAVVRGGFSGFIRSASGLMGILAGFWIALRLSPVLQMRIEYLLGSKALGFWVAFLLLFFAVYIFFLITGHLLRLFLNFIRLGWMDTVIGAVLGALKGLFITGFLCFLLTLTLPKDSRVLKDSYLYPRLTTVFRTVVLMVPSEMKAKFMWRWRRIVGQKTKRGEMSI